MLKIQSLASGSKGNVAFVASETTCLLIDIGIPLRTLELRMRQENIDPKKINGILITHEHSDHIKGVANFAKKYGTKIYTHVDAKDCFCRVGKLDENCCETYDSDFLIGDITVGFFPLPHDSEYCFGFSFQNGSSKISIATDLGALTNHALAKMAGSQIVMLESNHDIVKLQHNQKYPYHLKKRIAGNHGHLSNTSCCEGVLELTKHGLQQVILAHLSEENNSPDTAYKCLCRFLRKHGLREGEDLWVDIAEQDKATICFQVD